MRAKQRCEIAAGARMLGFILQCSVVPRAAPCHPSARGSPRTRYTDPAVPGTALPQKPGVWTLFWGWWHGRGMVVDDEPILAALDEREAVARGRALGLSVLDIGKRVIAGS